VSREVRLGVFGVLISFGLAAVAGAAGRELVEAILVRVNDRIVTMSDFQERLNVELSQLPSPPRGTELEQYAREVFETTVDELVLLERASEKDLTVDDAMVDSAIAELREQNELQDDAAFEAALEGAGLTVEGLRERYRHNILLQRAVQGEVKATQITEEEVRQRYDADKEQYRVPAKVELQQAFIPVAANGADRSQVLRTAQGLVERVRQGADLQAEAILAGAEIQELGAIPLEDLREDLRRLLEPLSDGDLADPVETAGGVQIIRLVQRIPAGYQPFDEVKETIRRQLSQSSYQSQTKGMVERLKQEYLVEIHEERLEEIIAGLVDA
jgi:parvulin-like peptidyl-prolyl isomerase